MRMEKLKKASARAICMGRTLFLDGEAAWQDNRLKKAPIQRKLYGRVPFCGAYKECCDKLSISLKIR